MSLTPEQQAADPNTSPEDLIYLAKTSNKLARIVASNPNTPTHILLRLGVDFPAEFVQNPILPLLILENPKFIDENYNTQISIATYPATPVTILKLLMEYGRYGVRKYIAQNPNTSVEMLEIMAETAITGNLTLDETPEFIAKNLKTPVHILEKLAAYMDNIKIDPVWFKDNTETSKSRLGIALANHPNIPYKVLQHIAEPFLRLHIESCKGRGIQFTYLSVEIKQIFQKLAASEETQIKLLENLVLYGDKDIRELVAKNPSTPAYLLELIANFRE